MRPQKERIVEVKHWWDRINGNSYFSARVYDLTMELLFVVPFQYGDKSHSEDVVVNTINAAHTHHRHKHDINRICYYNHTDDLKKWCVDWGKEPTWFIPMGHM